MRTWGQKMTFFLSNCVIDKVKGIVSRSSFTPLGLKTIGETTASTQPSMHIWAKYNMGIENAVTSLFQAQPFYAVAPTKSLYLPIKMQFSFQTESRAQRGRRFHEDHAFALHKTTLGGLCKAGSRAILS